MKPIKLTEGSSIFLDLIRAISVQMVVIGHGISFCAIAKFMQPPLFPYIQNIAVVIFFILSGFLISNSVFYKISTDTNYSFRSYFIDRFSRIYSAFIPALLFVIGLDYLSQQSIVHNAYSYCDAFNFKTFVGNLFMLQDFPFLKYLHIKITSFGSARPLWTLAIEWWIYMWFGVLVILMLNKRKLSFFTINGFVFLCIVPTYNLIAGRGNGLTLFWLFGLLIVVVYDKYKMLQLSKTIKFSLLFLLLIIVGVRISATMREYDFIFAFILAIGLLIGIELCSNINVKENTAKVIRLIANYSYTLYLIHYSIYDFIVNHFKGIIDSNQLFLLGFFISNILALCIGYFTETKLTKYVKKELKHRFA
jgi:peptidoglycan/LPS O-acetylase OafA/YrhL